MSCHCGMLPLMVAGLTMAIATASAPAQPLDSAKKKRTTVFFDSEEPVTVTLSVNLRRIRGDTGDDAPWRVATLSYQAPGGKEVDIPVKARTRGIWRLKNCEFPPIRLDFPGKEVKGTPFEGLNKPKLVSFCRNEDTFEQYVLQEIQGYRAYNLLTPASHRVRLLRVTYADSATGKALTTRYAIMLEEPDALAARFDGTIVDQKGARAGDLDRPHSLLAGLFQYFIANTDFSVNGLHNYELLVRSDGTVIPIPYDFDFSGLVNAQYATVDPSLSVRRVRDRLFRGYCGTPQEYAQTFALFNEKKDAIFALYNDPIGKLLDKRIVDETLRFFGEFYKTIGDPRSAKRRIFDYCEG